MESGAHGQLARGVERRQVVRLLDSEAYMYSHSVEKKTNTFLLVVNLNRSDRQYDAITIIIGIANITFTIAIRN